MLELTSKKILMIHDKIIDKYGGQKGILNEGSVEYLIYLLEKDNDIFKKASMVLYRIITNHPFMDGNKRTAFEVADFLLRHEGVHIHAKDEEIIKVLIEIAKYKCPEERIFRWLKRNTQSLHSCE